MIRFRPENVSVGTPTRKSHRAQAFAIINDFKGNRYKSMEQGGSDENLTGRFSPYTRYQLQREYLHLRSLSPESAPPLHTQDLLESDFDPYVYDEFNQGDGRKTSQGFFHKRALSTSALNARRRPKSEHKPKDDVQYQSTPNFIKLNKKMLANASHTLQMHQRAGHQPILRRNQRAILQVYNNGKRVKTPTGEDGPLEGEACIEPPKAPLPINAEGKRSKSLLDHQAAKRKRKEQRHRDFSPQPKPKDGKKRMTDRERREMFGLVAKRQPKKPKEERPQEVSEHSLAAIQFARAAPPTAQQTKKLSALRNITSLLGGRRKETAPPPPTTPAKPKGSASAAMFGGLSSQLKAGGSVAKKLQAKMSAKKELSKQNSRQSLMSVESQLAAEPDKKKRGSFSSLKSLSTSIKTMGSLRSNKSGSIDEEAAEAADEVTNLETILAPKDMKKKLQSGITRVKMSNRLTPKVSTGSRAGSAKSQKSVKEPPAPSRTASKSSLRSIAASHKALDAMIPEEKPPSRSSSKTGSDKLVPLSKFSIASMTTAAITSQPLAVTTTITNELARQGAGKKDAAAASERDVASSKAAETGSIASIKTMSSIRTLASRKGVESKPGSKPGSRKASAKKERGSSARPGSRIFISAANTAMAVRAMMKTTRSNDSIDSIHSDATQITLGQGSGMDNQDAPSTHLSGESLGSLV